MKQLPILPVPKGETYAERTERLEHLKSELLSAFPYRNRPPAPRFKNPFRAAKDDGITQADVLSQLPLIGALPVE